MTDATNTEQVENEIHHTLELLTSGVFEVRCLGNLAKNVFSGYYDANHLKKAAKDILVLDHQQGSKGIYLTLNELNPALLARRQNKIERANGPTTSDGEITRRRWLLVDVDPIRLAGISSSDEEHAAALDLAGEIAKELTDNWNFPAPILADSGNGAHLLYRIDLPNDDEHTTLVTNCLKALAATYSGNGCDVDTTVYNAARICKIHGTVGRKGDHTEDRPHRRSKILEAPAPVEVVSDDALRALAGTIQEKKAPPVVQGNGRRYTGGAINLPDWLREHAGQLPAYQEKSNTKYRHFYLFERCPWNSSHQDKAAWVGQFHSGALDAGCHHNGCSGKKWRELRELVDPNAHRCYPAATQPTDRIPTIYMGSHVPGMTDQALMAIRRAGNVFVRSGEMVSLQYNEDRKWVILQSMNREILRGVLMRSAIWVQSREKKDGSLAETEKTPPLLVLDDILSLSPHLWKIPVVRGVREIPIIRSDGTIQTTPGYDGRTQLIYHPTRDLQEFQVPDNPTPDQVKAAVGLINEMLHDFPFYGEGEGEAIGSVRDADRTNVFAALVTHVARPLITGPVPGYLVDKPQPRTGASLLQELMYVVLTGRSPTMKTTPESQEEWRKYITSELAAGTSIVVLDNIEQKLKSPALTTIITAPAWRDRKLGSTAMVEYENGLFVFLNGNNIQLSTDMAPRIFYTRLDAMVARPGEREGFLHPDVRGWVQEHRRELLQSIYVMVRAWIVAGRPQPTIKPKLGSFESWVDIVGGVLYNAGVYGFMTNQEALYDAADLSVVQWDTFLKTLREVFGGSFTVAKICDRLESERREGANRDLMVVLPDEISNILARKTGSPGTAIGKLFTRRRDVVYPSGLVLKREGRGHGGGAAWLIRDGGSKGRSVQAEINTSPHKSGDLGEVGEDISLPHARDPMWGTHTRHEEIMSPGSPTSPPSSDQGKGGEVNPDPQPPEEGGGDAGFDVGWYLEKLGISKIPDLDDYHRIEGVKVGRCICRGCNDQKMWEDAGGLNYLCDGHYRMLQNLKAGLTPSGEVIQCGDSA